jgi:transcriptional regulator with XRE-family HTH domain
VPARRPPSVRARQLAVELRRLREVATLTGEEAAAQLGWSASKVSRIETGRSPVSNSDLRRLLDLYEVPANRRERLAQLARTANKRGWWDAYSDTVRETYSALIAVETSAESVLQYEHSLVPGLLQTEAYTEEIVRSGRLANPPGVAAQQVEVRLNRQAALTREVEPLRLTVVLDEAVLRRQVGGPEVMRGQLQHLLDMSAHPNITLQVLPFARGSHPAIDGAFSIYLFPGAAESEVVFLENLTRDIFIEQEAEIYRYRQAFDRLREIALDPANSTALITQIVNSSD